MSHKTRLERLCEEIEKLNQRAADIEALRADLINLRTYLEALKKQREQETASNAITKESK